MNDKRFKVQQLVGRGYSPLAAADGWMTSRYYQTVEKAQAAADRLAKRQPWFQVRIVDTVAANDARGEK